MATIWCGVFQAIVWYCWVSYISLSRKHLRGGLQHIVFRMTRRSLCKRVKVTVAHSCTMLHSAKPLATCQQQESPWGARETSARGGCFRPVCGDGARQSQVNPDNPGDVGVMAKAWICFMFCFLLNLEESPCWWILGLGNWGYIGARWNVPWEKETGRQRKWCQNGTPWIICNARAS